MNSCVFEIQGEEKKDFCAGLWKLLNFIFHSPDFPLRATKIIILLKMSNLTNVYAYLRDKFQDVDMMLNKPTSYIKTLTKCNDQKVIFIFKEVSSGEVLFN
jgi:hypothetical protein